MKHFVEYLKGFSSSIRIPNLFKLNINFIADVFCLEKIRPKNIQKLNIPHFF